MREYNQTGVVSLDQLLHLGAEHNKAHPNFLDQEIEQGAGEDTAIMLYTSGTTGKPKGVVLTHNNLMFAAKACVDIDDLNENDSVLAYLPMAWVGDNVFSFAQAIWCGYCVNCPEGPETIQADMREIGPTYYFAPPRVFEGLLTNVTIRMEDAAPIKQKMYKYFMEVASGIGGRLLDGEMSALNIGSAMCWSTHHLKMRWGLAAFAQRIRRERPSGQSCSSSTAHSVSI